MKTLPLMLLGMSLNLPVLADSSTLDAAIGGGLGGAAGAAIGNELGGRDGAIIGGAIGGAAGTAIATDPDVSVKRPVVKTGGGYHRHPAGHPYYHCPPGQAKKGRC
jgi:hypothetical protein